jgi:hypothetical protein
MVLNAREFVEDAAHPESTVFDDGNLRIAAVELVLPSEPATLAPCRSVAPPAPARAQPADVDSVDIADAAKGKEKEEGEEEEEKGKEKRKESEVELEKEKAAMASEAVEAGAAAGNRKRKSRGGPHQWVFSSVADAPAYDRGDRSSSIVLAHDVGRMPKAAAATADDEASPPSAHAPLRKRTKCINRVVILVILHTWHACGLQQLTRVSCRVSVGSRGA